MRRKLRFENNICIIDTSMTIEEIGRAVEISLNDLIRIRRDNNEL